MCRVCARVYCVYVDARDSGTGFDLYPYLAYVRAARRSRLEDDDVPRLSVLSVTSRAYSLRKQTNDYTYARFYVDGVNGERCGDVASTDIASASFFLSLASDQGGSPAEFKHISKRRKRN